MKGFGAMNVEGDPVFEQFFGAMGVKHSEVYYNPLKMNLAEVGSTAGAAAKIDKRVDMGKQWIAKQSISTTTGGAGTAGYALIPVYVDPTIVDQTRYLTPLVELLPRRAVRGTTYEYNAITAKGGAKWLQEDASLLHDTDTYDRISTPIKYGYSVGRVTGQAIAGMRGYADAMQLDLSVKTQGLKELEEDTIINGDVDTYATEYNGIIQIITDDATAYANKVNMSSAYVTLEDIRTAIAYCFQDRGYITLGITDAFTHNYIKGLLMDFQRQPAPPAENLPFGLPGAFNFDGVDFIKSQFMPTTANGKYILLLDQRYWFMAVLQDVTYEELAKTNDSNKYMLKVYEALCCTYPGSSTFVYGIT